MRSAGYRCEGNDGTSSKGRDQINPCWLELDIRHQAMNPSGDGPRMGPGRTRVVGRSGRGAIEGLCMVGRRLSWISPLMDLLWQVTVGQIRRLASGGIPVGECFASLPCEYTLRVLHFHNDRLPRTSKPSGLEAESAPEVYESRCGHGVSLLKRGLTVYPHAFPCIYLSELTSWTLICLPPAPL